MVYLIAAIPMTLSDLQCLSPIASLFQIIFLYHCAAFDEMSTNTARRAVPLR